MTPDPLRLWQTLISPEGAPLRAAAAEADPRDVAAVTRLRRLGSAELVGAAMRLAAGRRGAAAKWPSRAATLVADDEGVQQASSEAVAAWKAARYREALGDGGRVADLCCGIGGDTMGLAGAGLRVLAVDLDPVRAWMAQRNSACSAAVADATTLPLGGWAFHVDPARRDERGRVWRVADYRPGPAFLRRAAEEARGGGIKLSPGVDRDEAEAIAPEGELEFISEGGRLVQAVLWTGMLKRAVRTASLVGPGGAVTLSGEPGQPPVGPVEKYLFAVDAAVERAELLGELCRGIGVRAIHRELGLLTAERPVESPWLTRFELLAEMPWRPKRVRQWLREHDGGIVEVKTRGKAVEPDRVQAELRGKGGTAYTVFVLRWDERKVAMIARRR